MAATTALFDANCFDVGSFDAQDVTPVVQLISVPRAMRVIEPGQAVSITAHIVDVETTPGRIFLFNPAEPPQIQLYDVFDAGYRPFTPMVNTGTGIYTLSVQTDFSDRPGVYSAKVWSVNGAKTAISRKVAVFTIGA